MANRLTISTKDVSKIASLKKAKNRRLMNDILYYLRKLLRLAKQAQQLQLQEGVEYDSVTEELDIIKEEIDRIEKEM